MSAVVALLVLATLISFYVVSWRLNHKLGIPEGQEGRMVSCGSCSNTSCGQHPEQRG